MPTADELRANPAWRPIVDAAAGLCQGLIPGLPCQNVLRREYRAAHMQLHIVETRDGLRLLCTLCHTDYARDERKNRAARAAQLHDDTQDALF